MTQHTVSLSHADWYGIRKLLSYLLFCFSIVGESVSIDISFYSSGTYSTLPLFLSLIPTYKSIASSSPKSVIKKSVLTRHYS